jgi:hypothetical protein
MVKSLLKRPAAREADADAGGIGVVARMTVWTAFVVDQAVVRIAGIRYGLVEEALQVVAIDAPAAQPRDNRDGDGNADQQQTVDHEVPPDVWFDSDAAIPRPFAALEAPPGERAAGLGSIGQECGKM